MIDLIQFPFVGGGTTEEQLAQINNYLFQLSQQLEIILSNIGTDNLSDEFKATLIAMSAKSTDADNNAQDALTLNTSIKSSVISIDDVVGSQKFKDAVSSSSGTALEDAKAYTESYSDVLGAAADALVDAKTYSDGNLQTAKNYSDANLNTAESYTDSSIADLVGQAPEALDTVYELAEAMTSQQEVIDAINDAIGTKADSSTTLEGYGITDGVSKTELNNALYHFGTCSTGRGSVDKVATVDGTVSLTTGTIVVIKFTASSSGSDPSSGQCTLNVNNTGAKKISIRNERNNHNCGANYSGSFISNRVFMFIYDGSSWVWLNRDTNTTYTFNSTYNESTNKAATMLDITNNTKESITSLEIDYETGELFYETKGE